MRESLYIKMKIYIKDLKDSPLHLMIDGTETWLDLAYSWFPAPKEGQRPILSGSLSFDLYEEAETLSVQAAISYAPYIPCDRCQEAIQVPLSVDITRNYFFYSHAPDIPGRELDLSSAELEELYLEKDGSLDLAELVNELIQLELPSAIRHQPGDPDCLNASELPDGLCVWGTTPDDTEKAEGPFSVLAKLKDPQGPLKN
ncbi:MAG: DUF177 domain-containing protein [Deltaproteobacteria bacterium]|nr:DUF177 domain-containing protein [Deltaproteobacteria bacterium]